MKFDPALIKTHAETRAAIDAALGDTSHRGPMRARQIARACGSDFAERRAMLTADFIVTERFPMLRPSFHWNDGPAGFLVDIEKQELRARIAEGFRKRLVVKYRRMMGRPA